MLLSIVPPSLETIKLYLKITDPELMGTMFDKALDKYTGQGVDQFTKGQLSHWLYGYRSDSCSDWCIFHVIQSQSR